MAYDNVTVTIPAPSGHYDVSTTFGSAVQTTNEYDLPALPGAKFKYGTGAAKVNLLSKLYTATLAAAPLDIDLTTLADFHGGVVDLARAKGFVVLNLDTSGHSVKVGDAASNAWAAPFDGSATAKVTLAAGCADSTGNVLPGKVEFCAPDATGLAVGGSSKVLRLDPGANTVNVAYFFYGCDS